MKFRKSYLLATWITVFFIVPSLISGFNFYGVLMLVVLILPFVLPLQVRIRDRICFIMSLVISGLSSLLIVSFF